MRDTGFVGFVIVTGAEGQRFENALLRKVPHSVSDIGELVITESATTQFWIFTRNQIALAT